MHNSRSNNILNNSFINIKPLNTNFMNSDSDFTLPTPQNGS